MKRSLIILAVTVATLCCYSGVYATPVGNSADIAISIIIPAIPGVNAPAVIEESIAQAPAAPAPEETQNIQAAAEETSHTMLAERQDNERVVRTVYTR